jgi:DNA-binding CsgD family transcriptional regulator
VGTAILFFYIISFATGFMGIAALAFFWSRARGGLPALLLVFQVLLLVSLGLVAADSLLWNVGALAGGPPGVAAAAINLLGAFINAVLYLLAAGVASRLHAPNAGVRAVSRAALGLSALFALDKAAGITLGIMGLAGAGDAAAALHSPTWDLVRYCLAALALAALGLVFVLARPPADAGGLQPLLRGYGVCLLVFAPMGILEYTLNDVLLPTLHPLSLDTLYFLAWNIISMAAFLRASAARLGVAGHLAISAPPDESAALGLTDREREMVALIARGLANKEIAAELGIAAATVRTHIYNLFQKAGARSRIELLRMLGSGPAPGPKPARTKVVDPQGPD